MKDFMLPTLAVMTSLLVLALLEMNQWQMTYNYLIVQGATQ